MKSMSDYYIPSACPPPICIVSAVMNDASLLAKNATTPETSSGWPNLPNMMLLAQEANTSGFVDFI
jgi:hypothetical protein